MFMALNTQTSSPTPISPPTTKNTHQSNVSILFVVAQCNLFNFHLDVASQIAGTLSPCRTEIPGRRLSGLRRGFLAVVSRAVTLLIEITLPLTVSKVLLSALLESKYRYVGRRIYAVY